MSTTEKTTVAVGLISPDAIRQFFNLFSKNLVAGDKEKAANAANLSGEAAKALGFLSAAIKDAAPKPTPLTAGTVANHHGLSIGVAMFLAIESLMENVIFELIDDTFDSEAERHAAKTQTVLSTLAGFQVASESSKYLSLATHLMNKVVSMPEWDVFKDMGIEAGTITKEDASDEVIKAAANCSPISGDAEITKKRVVH